jgi:hypothetical protein
MSFSGADYRDMIIHLATYFAPSVGKRHVDFAFQYKWEDEFYRGTAYLENKLRRLEEVYKDGGDGAVRVSFGSFGPDALREGLGSIEKLRYWKQPTPQ